MAYHQITSDIRRQMAERFNYETKWPRENEGGIEAIDAWCEAHPDARLAVVDVLAKFRAPSTNKNAYEQDYNAVSRLQDSRSGARLPS